MQNPKLEVTLISNSLHGDGDFQHLLIFQFSDKNHTFPLEIVGLPTKYLEKYRYEYFKTCYIHSLMQPKVCVTICNRQQLKLGLMFLGFKVSIFLSLVLKIVAQIFYLEIHQHQLFQQYVLLAAVRPSPLTAAQWGEIFSERAF